VVTKSAPVPPVLDEFLVLQAVKNPSEIRTAKYTKARNLIRIFLPEKESRLLYPFVYQEYVGSANLEPSSWSMGCGCKVASDDNRAAACRAASRLETWGLPRCGAHASRIEYAVNMLHLSNSAVLVPLSSALLRQARHSIILIASGIPRLCCKGVSTINLPSLER